MLLGFQEQRKAIIADARQLRQKVEAATQDLRQKRHRYAFVAQSFGAAGLLVWVILYGWLAISLVLAFSSGLWLACGAALLAALLPWPLQVWYRQQLLEASTHEWSKAQADGLRDQLNMFEKLYELAYLNALERGFQDHWASSRADKTQFEAIIADLEAVQAAYAGEAHAISDVDWTSLRAALITALVEAKQAGKTIDSVWLVNQVSRLGLLHNASRQTSSARRRASRLQAELSSLLCFKEAIVKQSVEDYQQTTFTLYHRWGALDDLRVDEVELDDQGEARRVTLIRLVCGLPLRALYNLDGWRRSYHASYLTQDQPPLERRALLHPTRLGLVANDIIVEGWPAALRQWPHLAMIVTLFLRYFAPDYATRQAIDWAILSQGSDEKLFYDELCGQFQQKPDVLVDWLERARRTPCREDSLAQVKQMLRDCSRLSVSEAWSEWESWTCKWIKQSFEDESVRAVICGLHQICVTLDHMSSQEKRI